MRERLFCSNGLDTTRVKRAFGWVVTFRDFPAGSWQTVDGDSITQEALTLFTKGRAEFWLSSPTGDIRDEDRVPGTLSTEAEVYGLGETFTLKYVEPTTRLCVPNVINGGKQPPVKKILLGDGETLAAPTGFRALICLGTVLVGDQPFKEESTFHVKTEPKILTAQGDVILLEFLG